MKSNKFHKTKAINQVLLMTCGVQDIEHCSSSNDMKETNPKKGILDTRHSL